MSDSTEPEELTSLQVAEILGGPDGPLSRARVYQLDAELRPRRAGPGRWAARHYDPQIVALVAAERRLRKASR